MKTEEFSKIMRDIEIASRYKSIVKNPKVNKILNMQLWWFFLLSSTCSMDQLAQENQESVFLNLMWHMRPVGCQ